MVWSTQVKGLKGRDVRQARCGPFVPDPEAADRLEPKGYVARCQGAAFRGTQTGRPPAERHDLTHAVLSAERGKPVALPLGKRAARPADRVAGKGGRSTHMSVCNRPERGYPLRGTSPHAKAGRLPSGLSTREDLSNDTEGKANGSRNDFSRIF